MKEISLFHPHVPEGAIEAVVEVLGTRWIGQGPKVDEFEQQFQKRFAPGLSCCAVGSCTDALHLAYLLAGIQPGDEVVTPVFTCTATNMPLLHIGAKIKFADVCYSTMTINPYSIEELMTPSVKAIVAVHYGGMTCEMDKIKTIAEYWGVPVIEDAAQALGAVFNEQPVGTISPFTCFSFQAIKHITTGDGGMLVLKNPLHAAKAKRMRWFGIDRAAKLGGIWENDIWEAGYKYQMTDIAAAMGIAGLQEFDEMLALRRFLYCVYTEALADIPGITVIGSDSSQRVNAAWLITVLAERREDLIRKLAENGIEAKQVHYRNDRYTIFKEFKRDCPVMDKLESQYLVLPLHTKMTAEDVVRICDVIGGGW